ncbi:MAG: hypothetical protein GQ468_05300 [Candidatus Scalindua sp.]|nr:hypothetical protein [Candidatus Scalindua sp.]
MAARKRKPTESFKQYRFNLKNEAHAAKTARKGKVFFNSSGGQTFAYPGNLRSYRT